MNNRQMAAQVVSMCDQWISKLRDDTASAEEVEAIRTTLHEMVASSDNFKLAVFLTVVSGAAQAALRETKKGEG
jgi:hypothetical protein